MKSKKIAVRGIIILACVVALCMFFSGTVRSIATAKVRVATPRQGKLSQKVTLSGELCFAESRDQILEGMDGYLLEIRSVKVKPGACVKAGDVLFTARVADYEKTLEGLRAEYDAAEAQLQALEQKDINLRRNEEIWAGAYMELEGAAKRNTDALFAWQTMMRLEGLEEMPAEPDEELRAAWEEKTQAESEYEDAREKMRQAERFSVSQEVRTYIMDKKKYEDLRAAYAEKIVDLMALNRQAEKVVCPENGYVTEIYVKAGENFDPSNPAYAMCSAEELPVIRLKVGESSLTMSKGMSASLTTRYGYEMDTQTCGVGITAQGDKYVDVALTERIIEEMGGTQSMAEGDISVKLEYKASEVTTLLPIAAVRGTGEERYVYVMQNDVTAFGENRTIVVRQDVTVLTEAESLASIQEDLGWAKVAYMEDRAIGDKSVVMEYND